jgi:hypothetical protein
LKGSSSRQLTVAKVEYSMHLSVNKISKSKQTRYSEVNCQNWSIRVVQNIIYSSASRTGLKPVPSDDLKRLAGCRKLFSYSGIQI